MAFTYAETRDNETKRLLTQAVDDFITQCQKPLNQMSACPRQTVFFFPGGMASQLTRATDSFTEYVEDPQEFDYEPVWVNVETPVGGARDLRMHRDSAGTFRDEGDRIIIADAALHLAGCTPHVGFSTWCAQNNADLLVFPWDWRRRLDETVTFFVTKFLPFFRDRVQNAGCRDPLKRFALVGHSFGGMIVNLILRDNPPILKNMTSAITVATPFYGYAGQLHRWFEGEPYVNFFGLFKKEMTEVIASLPGLYTLHFLDEVTFNGTNLAALVAEEFPLPDYPSKDRTTAKLRADAYNPQIQGKLVRYPTLTGFDFDELDRACLQFQRLASPMEPDLLRRFHNIRGVRTKADNVTPISDTVGSVTWDWIPTSFTASDPSPILDNDKALVPGDSTQPAWTARLATNVDRCITVKAHNIDHMFMMNHVSVLEAIQGILCPEGNAVSPTETPQPESASDEEIVDFLKSLSERLLELRIKDPIAFNKVRSLTFDDPRISGLIREDFRKNLPGIARRFISDVMKRPGPKTLQGVESGTGGREPRGPQGRPPKAGAGRFATRKSTARKSATRKRGARRRQRKPPRKKPR